MSAHRAVRADTIRAVLDVDLVLLDCLQANVAMVFHMAGVADLTSVLGAQWWFRDAEPGPEFMFESEAARIQRMTGLRAVESVPGRAGTRAACTDALHAGLLPIVISDAYVLPWVPYAGRRHMDHSFVVTGIDGTGISFTDLYENRTEWGAAAPTDGVLDAATVGMIDRCARTRLWTFVPADTPGNQDCSVPALVTANRSALTRWRPGDYASMARRHVRTLWGIETLAEIAWTVDRRRRLYARWLTSASRQCPELFPPRFAERFGQQIEPAWSVVNRFVYLAVRRMRAGRSAGPAVVQSIEAAAAAEDLLRREWITHD
jgi:hypothetical protein